MTTTTTALRTALAGLYAGLVLGRLGFASWDQVHAMHSLADPRLILVFGGAVLLLLPLTALLAADSPYDAIILALADLERLRLTEYITELLTPEVMLPVAGQGALAVQCRADNTLLRRLLRLPRDGTMVLFRSYYRADRYVYTLNLAPSPAKPAKQRRAA